MTRNQLKVALQMLGSLYLDAYKTERAATTDWTRDYYLARRQALRCACQMIKFAQASYFATDYGQLGKTEPVCTCTQRLYGVEHGVNCPLRIDERLETDPSFNNHPASWR